MPYRTVPQEYQADSEAPTLLRRVKCWWGNHEWSFRYDTANLRVATDTLGDEYTLASIYDAEVYCPHCGVVAKRPGTYKLAGPESEYNLSLGQTFDVSSAWYDFCRANGWQDHDIFVERERKHCRKCGHRSSPRMYWQVYD